MPTDTRLRFRQIHLDFHTHQSIEGIGDDFDADRFADTLAEAHVDSINLFARCHHGYVYYQSEAFKDHQHPHMKRDLLREQIAACKKRGIQTPIYITVQWDALLAERHPDWLCRQVDGKVNIPVGWPGFYNHLCVNSPYRQWLKDFTADVLEQVDGDGLWFDIVMFRDCFCTHCVSKMTDRGIDPMDEEARHRFAYDSILEFQQEMTEHANAIKPDQLVFYNSGHIGPSHRNALPAFTHLELESLPGGAWGYDHFPQTARYARTLGRDFLGMTGKFHTAWGDFHSFKTPESLKYECALMLALGGKCCVGDQLHPRGRICEHTYNLIGDAYRHVEACEPFCSDVTPVTDVAVLSPEAFVGIPVGLPPEQRFPATGKGVTRVLQELQCQFDLVDGEADLSRYKLVMLPDEIPVDAPLAQKLNQFVEAGGALIASHRGGLDREGKFAFPLGAEHAGDEDYEPSFVIPRDGFTDLPGTEHVMHKRGSKLTNVASDVQVLADQKAPYFNRAWQHYCSHKHAPSSGQALGPAAIQRGKVIYFTHPIFTQFHDNAPPWVRSMVKSAIDRLLPEPTLRIDNGATTLTASLNDQPTHGRRVLHLLHAIPVSNAKSMKTINEEIPLHDVGVSLAAEGEVKSVTLEPAHQPIDFERDGNRVRFTVPRVGLHEMVVVS